MFLRSVKAANGRHECLRLVENFRPGAYQQIQEATTGFPLKPV
jgi:hypothetical protein